MSSKKQPNNFFVVIEGLDGSGKTQISLRLSHLLSMTYGEDSKLTFEPHDPSAAGLFIRQVLMRRISNVSDKTLALAFAANRLDHCAREIGPFLASGKQKILVCDRYYLSSYTYQATKEVSLEDIVSFNKEAITPDLTIFLDASNQVCFERMKRREEEKELFERNLNQTRQKYNEAIRYVEKERGENVVTINADGKFEEVLNAVVNVLLEYGPDWLQVQPILSESLLPNVFTLNGTKMRSINDEVLKHSGHWSNGPILSADLLKSSLSGLREAIADDISSMSYNNLGGLFLSYIANLGYHVGEKLPWTELDAFQLEYNMPSDVRQRGVALLLGEGQRYDVIIKKSQDIERLSDFMFVFQPSRLSGQNYYYERDTMEYSKGSSSLSPTTMLMGKEDLISVIFDETLSNFYEEHFNTFRANKDLLNVFESYVTA